MNERELKEYLIQRLLATDLQKQSHGKYTIIEQEFLFDTLKIFDDLLHRIRQHQFKWKEVIEDVIT